MTSKDLSDAFLRGFTKAAAELPFNLTSWQHNSALGAPGLKTVYNTPGAVPPPPPLVPPPAPMPDAAFNRFMRTNSATPRTPMPPMPSNQVGYP